MSNKTLQNRGKTDAEDDVAQQKKEEFDMRWEQVADKVEDYVQITFHELKAASRRQTEELLNGLRYKPKDEKELEGWEKYAEGEMQKQIASARHLYSEQLMDPLLKELDKSVSARTIRELQEKFWNENVDYKDKEHYIKTVLPERIEKWRSIRLQRENILREYPHLKQLSSGKIKGLTTFLDTDKFLELKYPERHGLCCYIESVLVSEARGLEKLHTTIEDELMNYVKDGYLHRTKVGVWLKRIFKENMTVEEIDALMKNIVRPYAERWKTARDTFNEVTKKMNIEGVPRGLNRVSLGQFLLLDYDQRIAYLDEAESRLESDVNELGPLAALRLDIRHAMDTKNWLEAEELLGIAQGMDPNDKAVRSMGRYLALHRTDKVENGKDTVIEEKNKGTESLLALRNIMQQLPANMRYMTEKALLSTNPNTIKRLWQIFYNRHWVITHGYSNAHQDQVESFKEENHEDTEESLVNGNKWGFIRRTIKDDTANDAAIRDECIKPQVLYTNRTGLTEVYKGIERNADNAKFGYWTTLIDDEVPYESLREAVMNHMYHIKQHAKNLRESGLIYSSYGSPFSVN